MSKLEVMNFLNEVSINYPNAISFASGRPTEKYFDLLAWTEKISLFIEYFANKNGITIQHAHNLIGQYGRTNGVINELVAEQVGNDEGIRCGAEQVIITAGCQEAMTLSLLTIFSNDNEVLLVFNPSYIGITGLAETVHTHIFYISCKGFENMIDAVSDSVKTLSEQGKQVKAIYLVADFSNPTGEVMPEELRIKLIEYCAAQKILILEDNAYGMFRYEGKKIPTLYSLDQAGCVIYLGTYSKTLCPSVRIGFMLLPDHLFSNNEKALQFSKRVSEIKSFITTNTSQIMQALVGGVLLSEEKSLDRIIRSVLDHYKSNRDAMLQQLHKEFSSYGGEIQWNRPEGGFFISLKLPFKYLGNHVKECAENYDVICMPMSFFAMDDQFDNYVRLAFSNVDKKDIDLGVKRFSDYIKSRVKRCADIDTKITINEVTETNS